MSKGKSRELRNKIRSVQNTEKITKAMQLVSASKLRKATRELENFQMYFNSLLQILSEVSSGGSTHQLMKDSGLKRACVVVFSGERSLCGAYNSNAVKMALSEEERLISAGYEVSFVTIGKKGAEGLRSKGRSIQWEYSLSGTLPSKEESSKIAEYICNLFTSGEIGRIELVFTHFKSAASKAPIADTYLPFKSSGGPRMVQLASREGVARVHYLLEPSKEAIIKKLLETYLMGKIHVAFVHSLASEYGSRMIAMDSASKNAKEMIETLTLRLNRARQAAITQEIAEIVGGAASLE
jgi:F-type H+-transporting ATPase subunit gamma